MGNSQGSPVVPVPDQDPENATVVVDPYESSKTGTRLVLISDTHGCHRQLRVPPADVLVHAGDFTLYGRQEHALDFNAWLGELPHAHKIVALGNHESNAPWRNKVQELLSNATVLCDSGCTLRTHDGMPGLHLFATNFFWPMRKGSANPHYDIIPVGVDVLISHGPAQGYVDSIGSPDPPSGIHDSGEATGAGCAVLLAHVHRVRPRLLVSGHIHTAHGVEWGREADIAHTLCVNAANAGHKHSAMESDPIVVDLPARGNRTEYQQATALEREEV
mmetsp:Transcript_23185/g.62864  ORF Transcript_23185/g.62864 Transcript_23185/m.62864 type:complete len:275 (+) Transcript_23185:200-1024(+)